MAHRPSLHPPVRHCPVCGIAMQATRTRDDIEHFDRFDCLSCSTTINAVPRRPRRKPADDGA